MPSVSKVSVDHWLHMQMSWDCEVLELWTQKGTLPYVVAFARFTRSSLRSLCGIYSPVGSGKGYLGGLLLFSGGPFYLSRCS